MKFDSIIIGGGLSGLMCGIQLTKAGQRCAIISSGQSALHFSSGSLDLLSALPDGTIVTNPTEAVKSLSEYFPEHPYAKIGVERFAAIADDAANMICKYGEKVIGSATRNHYRLTPMGTLKQTWLTMDGYVQSDTANKLPWNNIAIFNAEGFLDFYPQFLEYELRKKGTQCSIHTFNMSALEYIHRNPSEMRSANIARIFDKKDNLDELARLIKASIKDEEVILLPAILGINRHDSIQYLEEQIGYKVAVIATLPPSVPGIQLQISLRRSFEHMGGVYMLGDTVESYEERNNRIMYVKTTNHGDITFEADNYILATGSYFSRGLIAERNKICEPLFNLDITGSDKDNRNDWYDRNLFEAQPFEKFGVATDENLHGLRKGVAIDNLYAIGAILAGFNPIKEGCGAGVSILTALAVADYILKKQR